MKLEQDLKPLKVDNIGEDSSHSFRLPLVLLTLSRAFAHLNMNYEYKYIERLRAGLSKTFIKLVLHKKLAKEDNKSIYYFTNNYMDGTNGIYRYKYVTNKLGVLGTGEYGLSGMLYSGFWSFLPGNKDIKEIYDALCNNFPIPLEFQKYYYGVGTTRKRLKLWTIPESYLNGYKQTIACMALKFQEAQT